MASLGDIDSGFRGCWTNCRASHCARAPGRPFPNDSRPTDGGWLYKEPIAPLSTWLHTTPSPITVATHSDPLLKEVEAGIERVRELSSELRLSSNDKPEKSDKPISPIHPSLLQSSSSSSLSSSSDPRPWWHLLMRWDCSEECAYQCMQQHRLSRAERELPTQQYFGKWPFVRVLGVQELFSSLFSVINGVPHALYLHRMLRLRALHPAPDAQHHNFLPHWMSFAAVAINTWLWSAVFHARDTWLTEKLDYFCAFAIIIWGLWVAVARTLHLRLEHQVLALLALLFFYFSHLAYMTFVLFDYGLNTMINAAFAFVSSFFWLRWAYLHRDRRYVYLLVLSIVGVYPMTLLELLDFSPFFSLMDAHALWHFSTIPFTFVMYEGVLRDLKYELEQHRRDIL